MCRRLTSPARRKKRQEKATARSPGKSPHSDGAKNQKPAAREKRNDGRPDRSLRGRRRVFRGEPLAARSCHSCAIAAEHLNNVFDTTFDAAGKIGDL